MLVLSSRQFLEGKGHVLVTDNYFSSIELFTELASREIYATGTMRANYVGLSSDLKNLRTWDRSVQGSGRCMHQKVWHLLCGRDKRPVILISTHAVLVQPPCIYLDLLAIVPRRNGAVRDNIHTWVKAS